MTLKEIYHDSIVDSHYWLQILIEFLVFEKEVHTFEDSKDVLDLYFMDKHKKRMNKLLLDYEKRMKSQ